MCPFFVDSHHHELCCMHIEIRIELSKSIDSGIVFYNFVFLRRPCGWVLEHTFMCRTSSPNSLNDKTWIRSHAEIHNLTCYEETKSTKIEKQGRSEVERIELTSSFCIFAILYDWEVLLESYMDKVDNIFPVYRSDLLDHFLEVGAREVGESTMC